MIAPQSNFLYPTIGFVVAMRARLLIPRARARFEWIIVSRSGQHGERLLISWTSLSASSEEPPLDLVTHQTALAIGQGPLISSRSMTFLLCQSLPEGVLVAGDFLPARGYVKLYGTRPNLRVQSVGRSLKPKLHPDWRTDAKRVMWFGEYFDEGASTTNSS
jgi:hypothetical protein